MNKSYFFNIPDFKFEFNINYVYNTYESNETSRSEALISFDNANYSSYANIGIKYTQPVDDAEKVFLSNSLEALEIVEYIKNNNLNISKFNFINEYQYDFNRIKNIKSNSILKNIIDENSTESNVSTELVSKISYGNNLLVNNNYLDHILDKISLDPFGAASIINEEYILNNYKVEKNNTITGNLFNYNLGFKVFKETNSYSKNKYKEIINIGFLIEKYNNTDKISSKFILNSLLSKNNINIDNVYNLNSNLNVKDYYVNYGKEYTYLIFPVFYAILSKENDYHTHQHFIICSDPIVKKIDCLEHMRPDCPQGLKIKYYNKNDSLYLTWSKPENKQNDLKGYHVYKRENITEPYSLIGIIDFSINTDFYQSINDIRFSNDIIQKHDKNIMFFEDKNFSKKNINIYTIIAVDAHGMFSNYSEQIAVVYNNVHQNLLVDLVSLKGAPLHMPNLFMPKNTKFFNNDEKIETILPKVKNKTKLTLYTTPDFLYIKDLNYNIESVLKKNYIFKVFKMENQAEFIDEINIKNFGEEI